MVVYDRLGVSHVYEKTYKKLTHRDQQTNKNVQERVYEAKNLPTIRRHVDKIEIRYQVSVLLSVISCFALLRGKQNRHMQIVMTFTGQRKQNKTKDGKNEEWCGGNFSFDGLLLHPFLAAESRSLRKQTFEV